MAPKANNNPAPTTINGARDELEVTKDNLRLFVERWREHPDSPYAVDGSDCPRPEASGLEFNSTWGQSPSPCGSLCSSEDSTGIGESSGLLSVPGTGRGAFDRRASEGAGSGQEKHRDPAAQIVLAEEIIKLSEHLRAIAQGPRLGNDTSRDEGRVSVGKDGDEEDDDDVEEASLKKSSSSLRSTERVGSYDVKGNKGVSDACSSNEISEKLSRIVKQRKTNGTAFGGVGKFVGNNEATITAPGFGISNRKNRRPFLERTDTNLYPEQQSSITSTIPGDESGWRTRGSIPRTNCFSSFNSTSTSTSSSSTLFSEHRESSRSVPGQASKPIPISRPSSATKEIDLTPPWRRAKLNRFNESGRDVPRISNLQDLHRSLNLDEPTSTKNLLLQLLEEWDDGQTATRTNGIGRKSVSLDWCGEESVARRSMNSLAEYFQSEQQKPPPGDPAPSVHR